MVTNHLLTGMILQVPPFQEQKSEDCHQADLKMSSCWLSLLGERLAHMKGHVNLCISIQCRIIKYIRIHPIISIIGMQSTYIVSNHMIQKTKKNPPKTKPGNLS